MHCDLGRNHSNIQDVADGEKGSLSTKSIEKSNSGESLEDSGMSPLECINSDQRFPILTFLKIDNDGHWRLVALPLQCHNNSNLLESGDEVKMDTLMVSAAPTSSFEVNPQQSRNPDAASSVKSSAARSFSGSNAQIHSRNKALNDKANKTNKYSGTPCRDKLTCSDFSDFLPSNSNVTNSADSSKTEKVVKRNSRKKARKKGKKNKKLSSCYGSTELEVFSTECDDGSSTSEICVRNDTDLGDGPASYATSPLVSLPELRVDTEEHAVDIVNCSDALNACPSYTREGDASEAILPSMDEGLEAGIQAKGLELAVRSEDKYSKDIPCFDDSTDVGFEATNDDFKSSSGLGCVSKSHPSEALCFSVECIASEPTQNLQLCAGKLEPIGQSNLLEAQTQVSLPRIIGKEVAYAEKEVPPADNSNQDHSSVSILQKWIPVGRKDSGVTVTSMQRSDISSLAPPGEPAAEVVPPADNSNQDHSSVSILQKWIPVGRKDSGVTVISKQRSDISSLAPPGEPAAEVDTSKNTVEEESVHNYVPSRNAGVMSMSQISGNVCSSSPEKETQIQNLMGQNTCTRIEPNAAANSLSHNMKETEISNVAIDSEKIAQAVTDVCRVQLVSEAVQMATGSPIAAFERLLYYASPVIWQHNIKSCQTCSPDLVFSASVCRYETPNISLGSLWRWYEKHGSYGLEVRSDDYKDAKRWGSDCFDFRAYFVPYLSAVQLFRNRRSNKTPVPIFSALVPRSRSGNSSFVPLVNQDSLKPSLVSIKDDIHGQTVGTTELDDIELLFEYFESEQPQKREPLLEKIKELIRGGGSSPNKMYGDPTTLASTDLRDLHLRSWYSVAWYPIYRIPDGDFHAAFLTYHSLGHLMRRRTGGANACVSPVVGLLSYNAQSEGWFQLRHPELIQTAAGQNINTTEILKDRLRTLERTAAFMATATVRKENLTSATKHPDFEFFMSRKR